MPHVFFALLIGYLIGSFPTAYLLVQRKAQLDIRKAGSGNVGALNVYDVTGSKLSGAIVLVVDVLKGSVAVWLCSALGDHQFWVMGAGGLAAVAGHNYPVWLKFKGGRGLATALGVMLILGWDFVAIWGFLWILLYAAFRDVHKGNIGASILSPPVLALIPEKTLAGFLPDFVRTGDFLYLASGVCLLILLRHLGPLATILKASHEP